MRILDNLVRRSILLTLMWSPCFFVKRYPFVALSLVICIKIDFLTTLCYIDDIIFLDADSIALLTHGLLITPFIDIADHNR